MWSSTSRPAPWRPGTSIRRAGSGSQSISEPAATPSRSWRAPARAARRRIVEPRPGRAGAEESSRVAAGLGEELAAVGRGLRHLPALGLAVEALKARRVRARGATVGVLVRVPAVAAIGLGVRELGEV